MSALPSFSLLSNVAKSVALLLHLGGLSLFVTLLMLQQSDAETKAQFATLVNVQNPYALPYHLGEILALVALLSITLPTLLQLQNNQCEAISPGRMVFLALMLVIVVVAFAVRTPIPLNAEKQVIGYLVLSQSMQLTSTYLIGMFTAFLGFFAIFRAWPRTVILLLMVYLLYFSSGNILFNVQLKDNPALLAAMSSFTLLMLLLAFAALWMLRPHIEEDFEHVKALQALKKNLKQHEKEILDSEMANTLMRFTRYDKEKPDPQEVRLLNMPTAATSPSSTSGSARIPAAELQQTQEALTSLQNQINDIREAHRKAEREKLAELSDALDDLRDRVNRTLIGG